MDTKTCSKCKKTQPLSGFSKNRAQKDGYQNQCKVCFKQRHQQTKDIRPTYEVTKKTKKCGTCGERKKVDRFSKNKYCKDGLFGQCKQCVWKKSRNRLFDLEPGQYEKMMEQQNGTCAICNEACPSGKALAVDHCHSTGAVRGLLCGHCNRGLGMFRDDPARLARAIEYLK